MEIEQSLPSEIEEKCKYFSEEINKIEKQLESIIELDKNKRKNLDPLNRAKIDLVSLYSINALSWLYHVVNGANPKDGQLPGELKRIQTSMKKVKDIEDKKGRIGVDSKAAKRVVTHELHQFKKRSRLNETE
jgi:exosome complex protein LRP1